MGTFAGHIILPDYILSPDEETVVLSRNDVESFTERIFQICSGRISICDLRVSNGVSVIFLGDFRNHFELTIEAIADIETECDILEDYIILCLDVVDYDLSINYSIKKRGSKFNR